ncbi:dihydroorotate dehydrogenase-like protein [Marinobacter orientalis]|uniref:Dihydroorotate dehydrogenase-like protein n=1 Tax=Marinobacter orientalis TaxID=1928859 RepID=A0A7Y0NJA6_9GAMM|nr:dihydroorotate dehydrogenase-like protein [Marinobacter orientalis]NMT62516.1 dihydroorotate dehydrogenase-like protein [Marinobacter orientalis]TGX51211.1 dihydroorotate dehydrogenase-like protein [Marinobacter orientalis]
MTELTTRWLGLDLRSPLVVGASPLTDDLEALKACVGAGAGAVVMHSLFEEQLVAEQMAAHHFIDSRINMDAEARSFFPESDVFEMGSGSYLKRLDLLQDALDVPVIASLNGISSGGWTQHARELEDAGAAAIELNLYDLAMDPSDTAATLEQRQLEVVRSVVEQVTIPVSVKLSSFYSALPAFVAGVEAAGARGLVLFNRFYQPDMDLDELELSREVVLSSNAELPLRLHGMAMLFNRTGLEMAASGGVHSGDDATKAILSGATVVQLVSALLVEGPSALGRITGELNQRLSTMGYRNLAEARGALSLDNAPNAGAWERLNYARLLHGWQSVQ